MKDQLVIGKFIFERWPSGVLFMRVHSGEREGEGMQVNSDQLEAVLNRFYEENF